VLDGFLGDMPRQIQALARFVESGSAREIEDHAHRIKGAAAAVSGEAMRAVALELELAGQAGDVEVARDRIGMLATQFELLQEAIKASR
jgi:HPt (histidine-containing phosphotransfer) domain-containing protein